MSFLWGPPWTQNLRPHPSPLEDPECFQVPRPMCGDHIVPYSFLFPSWFLHIFHILPTYFFTFPSYFPRTVFPIYFYIFLHISFVQSTYFLHIFSYFIIFLKFSKPKNLYKERRWELANYIQYFFIFSTYFFIFPSYFMFSVSTAKILYRGRKWELVKY